ncbi:MULTISPECIES: hypothetical protein [Mammaliicoccus]|uniref:hypothetical protein n=1 Tax=Mammaliicoccus TaxID=2803850 RepID=UPI001EFA6A1E|nr:MULTISPECIES: hypothetical protein [Mammaliicoccus]MEB7049783.1 hypothetical protein [Mammaliicoccus sciuri]MEB7408024.1 hypothetical protein [Mammaliicoccus sciuri]
MNYKRIAHSIVERLPTDVNNISMSYLNRVIGDRTKSPYDFANIKAIIVKDYMKQDTNHKTYKNYIKGGN